MARIKYPLLEQQKAAHKSFTDQLEQLKYEYDRSGYNIVIIIKANQMIINWLTQHISVMDRQIGIYEKNL